MRGDREGKREKSVEGEKVEGKEIHKNIDNNDKKIEERGNGVLLMGMRGKWEYNGREMVLVMSASVIGSV